MPSPAPTTTVPSTLPGSATEEAPKSPSPTSTVVAGRKYSLEIAQEPVRARMCGFGDKDRRPITPPPCIRLVVREANHPHAEIDVSQIDTSFFVLTVDLWNENGKSEVNLVRHSQTSPSISAATSAAYPPPTTIQQPLGMAVNSQYMVNAGGYSHPGNMMGGQPQLYPAMAYQNHMYSQPGPMAYHPQTTMPLQMQQQRAYYGPQPGNQSAPNAYYDPHMHPSQGPLMSPSALPGYIHDGRTTTPTPSGMFTRNLIGSLGVSAFKLTDTEDKLGIWFILQDLSVYSAKKFPGVIESTNLSRSFAVQGIKIPIRKDGTCRTDGEQYSEKEFQGLDMMDQGGFGCLAGYHAAIAFEAHRTSATLFFSLRLLFAQHLPYSTAVIMDNLGSNSLHGKRSRSEYDGSSVPQQSATNGQTNDAGDTSSEDDIGPALPSSAPRKKRRKLRHEKLYISALPSSQRYSRSLMHKDQLSFVTMTPYTDFLVTSSIDGVVKFWKKVTGSIEAVKEFRAHHGEIRSVSVSQDGRNYASAGADKSIKIFDVITFGASIPLLAVSEENSNAIYIYDGKGESEKPIHALSTTHRSPVTIMAYNNVFDCVISADEGGMVEYWSPGNNYEKPESVWEYKSSTDLFTFKKSKSSPSSITISPSGTQFATFSFPDRKIRVFDFASGKLYRSYDESIATITDMQQAGTSLQKLEDVEIGRRLAVEREIENPALQNKINVIFDESSNFIMYGSLHGVKVINILTNRVIRAFGKDEPFRSLNLALYQGQPEKKGVVTVSMAASNNPLLQEAEERDPMLVTTGSGKVRFYLFTNDTEITRSTRDIQNEKAKNLNPRAALEAKPIQSGHSAIIHTTYGDIHIRLFPDAAPKAVENFVTHSRNGYYNHTIFHRVIKKFMIQCGDPLGDGTGGESIWGKEFEDEFSTLKHDKPYTVSMANAGPNTNGSQFFITTEKAAWLDGKHTVFGRAVQGLDVVHRIENTRVWKEKPEEDIRIVNIDVV
ncbi:MAG: hypothetical protein Q9174_003201 [Haloplaca sp. 1 TL-2023]